MFETYMYADNLHAFSSHWKDMLATDNKDYVWMKKEWERRKLFFILFFYVLLKVDRLILLYGIPFLLFNLTHLPKVTEPGKVTARISEPCDSQLLWILTHCILTVLS